MVEKSRTPEGDRQGDGWGVAWYKGGMWHEYKSLKPMWETNDQFDSIPRTEKMAIHARSASFPNQIGNIRYNQPYIQGNVCFVFNGVLQGVKLEKAVSGISGAEKIFHLIQEYLQTHDEKEALLQLDSLLRTHSQRIGGLNIGIMRGEKVAVLCDYGRDPSYFSVRYHQDESKTLVCSEVLNGYSWKMIHKGEVVLL